MKLSEVVKHRIKSFIWRLAGVMVIAGLNFVSQDVLGWGLGPELTVVAGLVLGELTKFINSNLPELK